jgi:dipeptidyl aminopeptidase/acylaminoacyl peptidase
MVIQEVVLHSPSGRPFAADIRYVADGRRKPVVIFAHGFKGFKDWGCWNPVAGIFAEAGYIFIKFNFSHNGLTIGVADQYTDLEAFGRNTYSKELADLQYLTDWICGGRCLLPPAEYDSKRIAIIGHSRGGGISLIQTERDERIKACLSWAGVSSLSFMWEGNPALEQWKSSGVVMIPNARTGQAMPVYTDLLYDYEQHQPWLNIAHALQKMRKPCLIIHGDQDSSVPHSAALQLKAWYPAAELQIIPGADHVFGAVHPWAQEEIPEHTRQVIAMSLEFLHSHFQE